MARTEPSPDPLAVVRRRLATQGLDGAGFATAAEAVGRLGAMQAQEYAEAKWSIGERVPGATDASVEAAFARGEILRTHVLRPTWHFVRPADVRWLLRLTGPRIHAANRYMHRRLELDADLFARGDAVLAEAVAAEGPRTRQELALALLEAGIEADGLRLGYVLMHAELEEVLCSGPRRGNQQTYALLDDRAPAGEPFDRERALAELTRRYFSSHGPGTVRDFAAWATLTVADVRAGLERVGGELETAVADDGTAWHSAGPRPAEGTGTGFLLPTYDEMIMGYRDLKVVLAAPPPRPGLLQRAIVLDGRTVGSWRRTVTAREAEVHATRFTSLEPGEEAALREAVERFGRFFERPATLVGPGFDISTVTDP